MRAAPSVCILVLTGAVTLTAQQQQPPVFRASVNLVTQVVVVTDSQGRPVRGLTARDFILTEDGRPQTVVFAEFEEVDTSRLPPAGVELPPVTVEPEVPPARTTASSANAAAYRGRRLLVFYFDAVRMPFFDRERAFAGAVDYINRHMASGDMVSVMTFAGRGVNVHLDFTSDRAALIDELYRLPWILQDPDGIFGSLETGPAAFGEDEGTFNLFVVDRQLSALQTAVTGLGSVPQVKTLVYFGSGLGSGGLENAAQLRATVNAAVRAHVTLNPVDARGLEAMPPMADASRPSPGGIGMFSGSIAQGIVSRGDRERDVLYSIARDTGGRAIVDNNDLGHGVADVAGRVSGYTTMRNSRDQLEFRLDALQTERVAARPLQYETGFSLLPGTYVVKLLARDTTTGRIGTYLREFSIPDLARLEDRLRTSSVVLTQQRVASREALYTVRQQIPVDVANPLFRKDQRLVPSVTRTFTRGRPLHVFLEAYPDDVAPLVAWVALYREDRLIVQAPVRVINTGAGMARGAVPIELTVPRTDLGPGEYTCHVTVLGPAAGRATFWRAVVALAEGRNP